MSLFGHPTDFTVNFKSISDIFGFFCLILLSTTILPKLINSTPIIKRSLAVFEKIISLCFCIISSVVSNILN